MAQHQQYRFASRAERAREEALCSHYRGIGIQAVAAAKCVHERVKPQPATRPVASAAKPEDE